MKRAMLDIEVAPNAFLVGIMKPNGKVKQFSVMGKKNSLCEKDVNKLNKLLSKYTMVTFNGINYDSPVMSIMLDNGTCEDVYKASVDLVELDGKRWHYGEGIPNHIDLIEVAPGQASLKLYGARVGTKKLQDLPYFHHDKHTKEMWKNVAEYNVNDLQMTKDLYDYLLPQLNIRENIGKKYGVDVMSRSDAQIAEDIFKKILNITKKPKIDKPKYVTYKAPKYIKFQTEQLKKIKKKFEKTVFEIDGRTGKFKPQDWLKEKVVIDGNEYTIGFGGLHSNEKSLSYVGDIKNADIGSMYPSLIINSGKYPIQLGEDWLKMYEGFRDERFKIKHTDKELSAVLKIFLNGSYGKLNSIYSILYAPHLMIDTTVTGQLSLLMVIEALSLAGIKVLSANTDGVEYVDSTNKGQKIIDKLGKDMNLIWEHASYKALHARDVNSYVAVYDGYTKRKGFYAESDITKNPQHVIVQDAIAQYLLDGTPMEDTIRACKDVKKFCVSRAVTGGALWSPKEYPNTEEYDKFIVEFEAGKRKDNKALRKRNENYQRDFILAEGSNHYVGKSVRFYYSTEGHTLYYYKSGNKVPLSEGCKPMMELKNKVPKDLDYDKYIELCYNYLNDLGFESN